MKVKHIEKVQIRATSGTLTHKDKTKKMRNERLSGVTQVYFRAQNKGMHSGSNFLQLCHSLQF